MWNHTGNILLHKDDIGRPKPPCTKLPSSDWVYGNHNRQPEDGVNKLIHDWKYHDPTQDEIGDKDFCKMNKVAVKKGQYTSSGFRTISKESGDRIKPYKGKKEQEIFLPEKDFVFGVANKPSTPVKKVINNDYGNESEKWMIGSYADQMAIATMKTKTKFTPGNTKAANLNKEINNLKMKQREQDPKEKHKNLFKMQKFGTVHGKVNTNRKPFDVKKSNLAGNEEAENRECDGGNVPEPYDCMN